MSGFATKCKTQRTRRARQIYAASPIASHDDDNDEDEDDNDEDGADGNDDDDDDSVQVGAAAEADSENENDSGDGNNHRVMTLPLQMTPPMILPMTLPKTSVGDQATHLI